MIFLAEIHLAWQTHVLTFAIVITQESSHCEVLGSRCLVSINVSLTLKTILLCRMSSQMMDKAIRACCTGSYLFILLLSQPFNRISA